MPQSKEALFSKKSYGYFMPKLRHSSRAKRNKWRGPPSAAREAEVAVYAGLGLEQCRSFELPAPNRHETT